MKRIVMIGLATLTLLLLTLPVAAEGELEILEGFDTQAQLEALGKDELMGSIPDSAKELLEETELYDLSVESMLHLSPRQFMVAVWRSFVGQVKAPLATLSAIVGIVILCSLMNGMKDAAWNDSLGQVFAVVSTLCILGSVAVPILDCIIETAKGIQDAATFMLSFIPVLSASLVASGQPVTGATYNMFLFSTCQVVSQVVSQTLVPLMGIYLALCIVGNLVPDLNIGSATGAIKTIVSWALGFSVTLFVGLLSVQTLVSGGADSVSTRTTKFLIGSFVPVVGGALSEAFVAAQGCLRLIKTTVGAYGIIVALFTFLPIITQTVLWYMVTNLGVVAGDLAGVPRVSSLLKSCSNVLGVLIAMILCFGLLIVVSTTVVLVTSMGTA